MKKIELLSPAGNFDALKGALKAGADAVYLGGASYSARAYADNFTAEEICAGIHLAHVFGKKVYLTVNTLVKERELEGLYDFLLPFYEEGLDGVIVQDVGALSYIRKHFPGLLLHASTQMTITGQNGAELAMKEGISRIVPARELSLGEIKAIRDATGVEIETFIHGAMCYCYSGQCLFSSLIGGRSGNRGRCAQPCRLPYETKLNSGYLLSMKDMCTLKELPKLIEAGIDSLKIEGRMKKPAYAAGVTAIYRKYIDLYYKDKKKYQVAKEDMETLKSLYIRSEISDGYYFRHNGKEMISLSSPAYSGADEKLLTAIEQQYIHQEMRHKVRAQIRLKEGSQALLTLYQGAVSVTETGDYVQKALKQPLTVEKIKEQICKSGNSLLDIEQTEVAMDAPIFMPIKALNELRRRAGAAMEKELIRQNGLLYEKRRALLPENVLNEEYLDELCPKENSDEDNLDRETFGRKLNKKSGKKSKSLFHVSVLTGEQLLAALEGGAGRIYLDYGLLGEEILEKLKSYKESGGNGKTEFYIAVPYIVREKDICFLEEIYRAFSSGLFAGVLIRNLESLWFFSRRNMRKNMVLDANLYVWNREALNFYQKYADEFYLPLEYHFREWKGLLERSRKAGLFASAVVYGRLPMMISANCLKKTAGKCNKTPEMVMLKDRYGKIFPVYTNCSCCYNIIYNSVPLSLHKLFSGGQDLYGLGGYASFRLDFTLEDKEQTLKVLEYFKGLSESYKEPFYKEYTTGHYKRGVE